jgi:hypothetical protein
MAKTAIVDKKNGGGKQSAISWERDIVVVQLNFAAKTYRVKQEGQETTCRAVLLVEHKPAVALKYLYDHHFGNALVREWINKSLAVRKAVVGWSSLETFCKRMNWPVKPVSSSTPITTPENHGKSGGWGRAVMGGILMLQLPCVFLELLTMS